MPVIKIKKQKIKKTEKIKEKKQKKLKGGEKMYKKVYYFVNREKYFDEIKEIGYEPIPKGLLLKVVVEANYLPEFVCLKKEFEKIIKEKDIKVLYIGR